MSPICTWPALSTMVTDGWQPKLWIITHVLEGAFWLWVNVPCGEDTFPVVTNRFAAASVTVTLRFTCVTVTWLNGLPPAR